MIVSNMKPVSQIIERNLHRATMVKNVLWANPEKDQCWLHVKNRCSNLTLFCQDFSNFAFLQQAGANSQFLAFPAEAPQKYQWIILNLPRQKALLRMLIDSLAGLLADDGVIWLAGQNKAGIKSADKLLKARFGQVKKLDNARHCTLFEASRATKSPVFDCKSYQEKWLLDIKSHELRVVSYPGVFAHGRLDAGTSLLLEALAGMDLAGEVLDFACGAGVIGAYIAHVNPGSRLSLLDINALALRSSEETFNANQLQANSIASDGLSEISGKYDFIVSNPPIHASVKTDNQLGARLLGSAHQYLNPGGALIIVANIHLPYENLLSRRFRHQRQLLANDRYKVIAATI